MQCGEHEAVSKAMGTVSLKKQELFHNKNWKTVNILYQGEIWKITNPTRYENTNVCFINPTSIDL